MISEVAQLQKAGKARVLATLGTKRSPSIPDIPTFKEQGYDGLRLLCVVRSRKDAKQIVDRYSTAAIQAVRSPRVRDKLEQIGLEPTGLDPKELAAIFKSDYGRWGPVIRASGFKGGD